MNRRIITLVTVLSVCFMFCSCNGTTEDKTAPVINGVKDSVTIQLGDSFNALEGVTATDDKDGDVTSSIEVSAMPDLTFTGGVATPDAKGAYEITYSVKDKAGNVTEEYCTLTVTSKTSAEETYHNFDFTNYDVSNVDTYFDLVTYSGAVANFEKTDGILRLNVTSTGNEAPGPNSVTLYNDISTTVGYSYKINVYMKSSAPVWFNMIANHTAAGWLPLGTSNWNFAIPGTPVYTLYTITFDAPAAAPDNYEGATPYNEVKYFLEMGAYNVDGIGTNPSSFTVDILKVETYEIVGTEYEDSLKSTTVFTAETTDTLTVAPAVATTSFEDGKAVYNVTSFVENAAGWEIHLRHKLGTALEADKKYTVKYTFDTDADITAGGGICVEHITQEWQNRACFVASPVFAEGEHTYQFTFTSSVDLSAEDAIITWYLKDAPEGKTTSTIKLSYIEVAEVKGNKTSDKKNYHFYPEDDTVEWTCWNDTDDDLGQNGLGFMYYKNGALVFDVETVSGVDYGNKIFNKSLTFEEGCLYKIEVKVKANKDCTCWFILNPPTSYDPIISQVFDVTTEESTITFATTSEFVVDKDLQLIFSFGSDYNRAGVVEGGLVIEFTSVKVIKLS
ncbi:MAG: DUF5011 domain-containing protein [Clostridia bacterium]|nr:DUF5011 domain-containing protein [Clostridia bacterium]